MGAKTQTKRSASEAAYLLLLIMVVVGCVNFSSSVWNESPVMSKGNMYARTEEATAPEYNIVDAHELYENFSSTWDTELGYSIAPNNEYGLGQYELITDTPPCRRLFVIWTTDETTWQPFNSVSLESIFRYDPCAQIFVYANNLPLGFFKSYTDAGYYIIVERYDLNILTKGLPGEKWVTRAADVSNRSPFHAVHESDFLRTFMLYHNGGSYVDLDHFMLPMSRHLAHFKNVIGAEACADDNPDCFVVHYLPGLKTIGDARQFPVKTRFCAANGVLLNWDRHHIIMEKALEHFDENYDPQCWGCAGPRLMGLLIPKYSQTLTLVAEKLLYPVHYSEAKEFMHRANDVRCDSIMRTAMGYHMYGKMVAQEGVRPGSLTDCIMSSVRLRSDDRAVFDVTRTPVGGVLKHAYKADRMMHSQTCETSVDDPLRNVAVVLLAYKRADFIGQILQSVSASRHLKEVVIWNNNAESHIDPNALVATYKSVTRNAEFTPCIRVYNANSDGNLLFLGRYAACLASSASICYFQDDDWIVGDSEQLFHLAQEDPHRIHSTTNGCVVRIANTWKFGVPSLGMDSQFSWVGTGAVASKQLVQRFFLQMLGSGISATDRTMADFFFTAWTNTPQDVMEGEITELTRENAFSGAEGTQDWAKGTERNVHYIEYSVRVLHEVLSNPKYAKIRHMFMPFVPSTAAIDPFAVNANTGSVQSQASTALRPGCTVTKPTYRAIVRTDASQYGDINRPQYDPLMPSLDAHVLKSTLSDAVQHNMRNLVDGNLETYFVPLLRNPCHNISMALVQPIVMKGVSLTLNSGPQNVNMYAGMRRDSLRLVGQHNLNASLERSVLTAANDDVVQGQTGFGEVGVVVIELCAREKESAMNKEIRLYELVLS
ncbi:hypothetical protein SARC_08035 [Sphaeroforma arctica JP610]|uniref:Alpha 1,4-glycosyltransferase domain-containing protein n=1 Tax=Sphaeroforma arctica JP610 TaxID=667725 RepID=A0A0L0FSA4_9EUKA|nr:hypothetical protein SARC_08035 [Sphaeroforma arctica JP610]KNC79574.1 hypothetical protein SARC_08035 [Sphaeroforma arctica JP610]|eukprot:XP_014153476.1 hypothetical protein SARC_08035 [Sphaeroforma arctica JP610]